MKLRKDIPGKLKVLCLRTRTVLVVCQSGIVRVLKKRFLCEYRSTDGVKQKKGKKTTPKKITIGVKQDKYNALQYLQKDPKKALGGGGGGGGGILLKS